MMNHKVIASNNARVWPRVCVNPHRLFSGPYLCPDMPPPLIPRFNKKNLGKRSEFQFLRSLFFREQSNLVFSVYTIQKCIYKCKWLCNYDFESQKNRKGR